MPTANPVDLMRAIAHAFDDQVTASLQRAGYSEIRRGQLVVLELVETGLAESGRITARLGTTQQWVSKCLKILLAEGCVQVTPYAGDGRRKQFTITDRGRGATAVARAWSERFADYGSADLGDALQSMLADADRDLHTTPLFGTASAA